MGAVTRARVPCATVIKSTTCNRLRFEVTCSGLCLVSLALFPSLFKVIFRDKYWGIDTPTCPKPRTASSKDCPVGRKPATFPLQSALIINRQPILEDLRTLLHSTNGLVAGDHKFGII